MTPDAAFGEDYWRAVDTAGRLVEVQLRILREVAARKAKHNPVDYQCQATWHPEPPTEGNT